MSNVDDQLASFADEIVWMDRGPVVGGSDRRLKTARMRASQGMSSPDRDATRTATAAAHAVREHVHHLVRRTPQVVVKVTGGGADMKRIRAHLMYIQRSGRYKARGQEELTLENENGDLFQGKEGRELAEREFAEGGYPIPAESLDFEPPSPAGPRRHRREALNVIFSMPGGTAREEVMHAARAAARVIFDGHQWLMAHHDDTDNPHSHFLVKMVGHDGTRMNPRKADLERWRIVFARELQARGVPAVATRRRVRVQRHRGESQAVREMKQRGVTPCREATAVVQPVAVDRAIANEARLQTAYAGVVKALSESESRSDQRLARELSRLLQQRGWTVRANPSPRMGM